MLLMIALTVDEVVAMGQFLHRRTRRGESLWRAFWMGGTFPAAAAGVDGETRTDPGSVRSMFWGVSVPWNLLVATGLGLWLMASPAVFGTAGAAADSSYLVGALVVTFSVVAMGEPARTVRLANVPLGAWVAAAPWVLQGAPAIATWNGVAVGVLLALVSIPRGTIAYQYGIWNQHIR
ncbi:SPW repeat domain-containing protein [Halomarina pelagica]|uniref:SPW repeat domain-containing protein n=1 Tax=Halomarina pelagica TaxID=2961599 RepID=UPI0020C34C00|nr:hypothetical protein [Halomarina sp. BND7]